MHTRQQIKNRHRDKIHKHDVYIGRGTPWGNPFRPRGQGPEDRTRVMNLYARHLNQGISDGMISAESLKALSGQALVCFCAPRLCHGEVLREAIEIASGTSQETPRWITADNIARLRTTIPEKTLPGKVLSKP